MNNYKFVDKQIETMKSSGMKKCEIVQKACELCLGWPYVFGGYGQYCTPANRKSFAERSSCPEAESEVIKKKCQVLNSNGNCPGCRWYPDDRTRFFDCRGFTRWILQQVGITLQGGGATSQWNDDSNWITKGQLADMPMDAVCCVFQRGKSGKMEHTGMHIGGGVIIHCSGEVKYGKTTDRGWTHFAIPNGMDGDVPVPTPTKPTIRKGSTGTYVVECQNDLIQLGYDLSPYGADGKFGGKTETAVKNFQKDHELTSDGIVGPMTWDALDKAIDPSPSTKLYTAHIPHQTETQCKNLLTLYPDATFTEE